MRHWKLFALLSVTLLFLQSCVVETVTAASGITPGICVAGEEDPSIVFVLGGDVIAVISGTQTTLGQGSDPQISCDVSGRSVVVWVYSGAGGGDVIRASVFDGMNWTPSETLSDSSEDAESPQVAAYPTGKAVAVWERDETIQASIFDGSSWSTPEDLSDDTASSPQVSVASSDGQGRAAAVWLEDFGSSEIQVHAAHLDGGIWVIDGSISTDTASEPQVCSFPDGKAAAVWTLDLDPGLVIQAANFDGSSWSSAVTLSSDSDESFEPQVDCAEDGTAVAVWTFDDGTNTVTESADFNGTNWSTLQLISDQPTDPSENTSSPQVAVDEIGVASAVWEYTEGGVQWIKGAGSTPLSQGPRIWTDPVDVSDPDEDANDPQVSAGSVGNFASMWLSESGGVQALLRVNFDQLTGESNKDRFFSQTDIYNRINWRAPADVTVASYEIFRADSPSGPIGTVPGYVTTFIDHNRKKNETAIYLILGKDASGDAVVGDQIEITSSN